ncbi:MAG: efflux RND transporter permease subunit [Bacteroidaceae bacterium]|nr:efflux RND transporter permease subunit [Bacteroidaceae bacterium]
MLRSLIRRPIAVTMCVIALLVLGIISTRYIPVSLMPNIDIPRITVQMNGPGMSAQEVDETLIGPMGRQLMQVGGLKDIRSESKMDGGTITMTFEPGSNMSLLFIEVNEKVDRAMNYMSDAVERPKVMKASAMDIPAMYLDIKLKNQKNKETARDADVKFAQLGKFARNVVSHRIEQIPQTAMVDVSGTIGTEIICIPNKEKMNALGISTSDIERAISDNNITLEALSIVDGIFRYSIHFDSQILNKEDIENIYINYHDRLLQLKELCKVEEVVSTRNGLVRNTNDNAVTLAIIKQNDAQMSDLQESMSTLVKQLSDEYPDIEFQLTRDQTQLLSYSINNLEGNLIVGAILACVILFLFMRNWRLPILIIFTVPLSLILTLMSFYLLNISVNVISLSGLILGVGMIVDNSIIVIDNIVQKWTAGAKLTDSVVKGTTEVFAPMLSSVLTTCSVFIPLIFLSGIAGALFYDQAMGITTSLFSSLFVASLVIPVYFYAFFKRKRNRENCTLDGFIDTRLYNWYEKVMKLVMRNIKKIVIAFSVMIVLIIIIFPFLKKERMPEIEYQDALVSIDWNEGISAEENDMRIISLMNLVKEHIETTTAMVGNQEFILSHTKDMTASESVVYMKCHSNDDLLKAEDIIQKYLDKNYPKCKVDFSASGNIYDFIFSSDKADLEIHLQTNGGGRPPIANSVAFVDSLKKHIPGLNVQPITRETQIQYVADVQQMAQYKVDFSMLYGRLKELLSKNQIYEINSGAQSIPVYVGVNSKEEQILLSNSLTNREGVEIPISYLVAPKKIYTYKRLYSGIDGDYCPVMINGDDDVVNQCMEVAEKIAEKDKNLSVSFFGDYFDSRSMIKELAIVFVVAVLLLYFILAAQFESMVQPLIILSEIVVDVLFVLLVLWILGISINLMSMIGIVVMCGIIINDSILKVDTINRLKRGGMPLIKAIMVAGHSRLKPIIMTSLTTILALLPFLHKGDMGAALQFPLSLTLIAGMLIGTLVSLFFVPMVYYIIYRKSSKK